MATAKKSAKKNTPRALNKKSAMKKHSNISGTQPITKTLPLCGTPQPQAPVNPPAPATINNPAFTPSPQPDVNFIHYPPACCYSSNANAGASPSDEQRISDLESKYEELNKREAFQEHIHRNVLPNGNVTHYYNIMPTIVIAALTGGLVALAVPYLVRLVKNQMA